MIISASQIKGLIAFCLTLAVIPLFSFLYNSFISYKAPPFTDQLGNSLAIEVAQNNQTEGIYFVSPETSAGEFLKTAGIAEFSFPDFPLTNGMRIAIGSASGKNNIMVTEMEADKRLALGMRLDINKVTEDDLLLISGIGEATVKKILDLRCTLGRFQNIEQLMEIKGIKEKRLAQLRKYLCVGTEKKS